MKNRKWVYLVIGVLLVGIAIRIYTAPYMRIAHAQQKIFDATYSRYANSIKARDYAAAYSLGSQEFRQALSEPDFVAGQQSLEGKWGKLVSSETENFKIEGHGDPTEWIAKLRERRHYEKGEVQLLYEFHFDGGRWQLFGYTEVD